MPINTIKLTSHHKPLGELITEGAYIQEGGEAYIWQGKTYWQLAEGADYNTLYFG